MPIYEYRCKECHQVFEEWLKHFEEDNVEHECPVCKGVSTRIMSNTSFALKGGGWYVTEYGGRSADTAATASSPSTSAAEPAASGAPTSAPTPAATPTPAAKPTPAASTAPAAS